MAQKLPYSQTDTLLKVENVSLKFDKRTILRDINLEIKDTVRPGMQQGQVVGLLGPSGRGKTQLFRILSGLLEPDSGTVMVGNPLQPVQKGMVGVVAQNYPLFNHYTIQKNLEIAAKKGNVPTSEMKDKIAGYLKRFKLETHAKMYPMQLSGGQRQRVAIIQQLLCSSHFLLMDEPFSGLDPRMVSELCEIIQEIATQNEQNTIIIVSHGIFTTASISDEIYLLGVDRDADGNEIPGSTIIHHFDLKSDGLAWRPDLIKDPAFGELVASLNIYIQAL